MGAEVYPFRRFKIKKEKTMKRSLTVQDLRRLRDYPCEKWQRVYVDMFMLSFYLCGINMVDLVALPKIKRGSLIEFRRSKTGVPCRMKVPEVAWEIIDRYGGRDRLVSFGEDCCSVEAWHNRLHRMNMALQKIGPSSYTYVKAKGRGRNMKRKKVYVSLFPELTSYWARHTWATLAAESDVPEIEASIIKPDVMEGDKVSTRSGYNYQAMATYLEKYWSNYNPAYRSFAGKGGDCTNFVSQALRAGGWADKSGWYKSSDNWWYNETNQTWSWVNVDYLGTFARSSGRCTMLDNVWKLRVGDFLQVKAANATR